MDLRNQRRAPIEDRGNGRQIGDYGGRPLRDFFLPPGRQVNRPAGYGRNPQWTVLPNPGPAKGISWSKQEIAAPKVSDMLQELPVPGQPDNPLERSGPRMGLRLDPLTQTWTRQEELPIAPAERGVARRDLEQFIQPIGRGGFSVDPSNPEQAFQFRRRW